MMPVPFPQPSPDRGERRRTLRRRRRQARTFAFAGWVVLGGTVAVGRLLDQEGEPADPPPAVPGPPAPVEPAHPAVTVVAEPPAARPKRPLPTPLRRPFAAMHAFASPLIMPRLSLPRVLTPRLTELSDLLTRAKPGRPVSVMLSAYCLQGLTKRGRQVRPGIIAADPRVFPLARHVELFVGGRFLGRFLVDDTGKRIRGTRIDIWTPDCDDARRFGMRSGIATLVAAE